MKPFVPVLVTSAAITVAAAWLWKGAGHPPSGATNVAPPAARETMPLPASVAQPREADKVATPPSTAEGSRSYLLPSRGNAADDFVSRLVQAMEAALGSSDFRDQQRAQTELWPQLIARDRTAALALLGRLPSGSVREDLTRILAREWAVADFAGAIGWAATLVNPSERKIAFQNACLQVGETNPAEAVVAWDSIRTGGIDPVLDEGGDLLLGNLLQGWAEKDFAASLAWARDRPAGERRDQALARVAFVLAKTAPAEAAGLISSQMGEGPSQTEAAISVLHQWALRDLPAATAWVDRFPNGPLAARARNELTGMAQYLQTTPAGK